jgi:hypothetical protein
MILMDTAYSSWFDRESGVARLPPGGGDRPQYGKRVAMKEEKTYGYPAEAHRTCGDPGI